MLSRAINHEVTISTNRPFGELEVDRDLLAIDMSESTTVSSANHLTITNVRSKNKDGLVFFTLNVSNEPESGELFEKPDQLCMEFFPHLVLACGKAEMAHITEIRIHRPDGKIDIITHNPSGGYKRETIAQQKNA
jgi:hypothetical protein